MAEGQRPRRSPRERQAVITIPITQAMADEAKALAEPIVGAKHNFNGASASWYGMLGELAVMQAFPSVYRSGRILVWSTENQDYRLDVKTKRRSVRTRASHEASVAAYQIDSSRADVYMFVSIYEPEVDQLPKEAEIIGFYPCAGFSNDPKVTYHAGGVGVGSGGRKAAYNIFHRDLEQV